MWEPVAMSVQTDWWALFPSQVQLWTRQISWTLVIKRVGLSIAGMRRRRAISQLFEHRVKCGAAKYECHFGSTSLINQHRTGTASCRVLVIYSRGNWSAYGPVPSALMLICWLTLSLICHLGLAVFTKRILDRNCLSDSWSSSSSIIIKCSSMVMKLVMNQITSLLVSCLLLLTLSPSQSAKIHMWPARRKLWGLY